MIPWWRSKDRAATNPSRPPGPFRFRLPYLFVGAGGVLLGAALFLTLRHSAGTSDRRASEAGTFSDSSSPSRSSGDGQGANVFDAIGDQVNRVFEDSKEAVVRVRAQQDGDHIFIGSGFFVDEKGTIVTAASVLGNSNDISVEANGLDLPVKVLGVDPRSGLAVLQVFDGVTPYLPMAAPDEAKTAMPVVGVGYPFNLPPAPTFGMVTGFDSQYLSHFFATTHLRTSLSISPGQIGGPVLDGRGAVVGMIVTAADDRKLTYVLPSAAIQKILVDINLHGRVEHGWVGVGVDPNAGAEVRITQLFQGTPAAASGLQPGDVVVRIDNREINRPADVIDASFFSRVGEELPVVVSRKGELLTFKFVVTERPDQIPIPVSLPNPGEPPQPQGVEVQGTPVR